MNLTDRIEKDYLAAYKARDEVRLSVLRMLKTAAKNRQVELLRPLSDDELAEVLAKQAKQRRESIEQFGRAGRDDLRDREERELSVLNEYLPTPLTEDELFREVDQAIAELGAQSVKDMGRVVSTVLAKHKGRADGKMVSDMARSRLAG
ncbi:GatB/YqeY domain-containing protein [Desulfovibrio sulfodismutans]|uniref:GatB/YqeY domain-containing protein n=1 Tax=Desulfolutivibrio sulfodismutans TaxID=63561 RepID=A0A7K3NH52_9BACT|nr:GatB/YqeY domain-containing protein [Desulfolutivibrio sulfodismutans]NDY55526.1 GatB/YqeY domain-containing protein [Desulfolutivibrio sulfodismutans]QLA11431.1 GatB/YqeY domain-containing protein [Desulfolutivibrio sulfodismutans DSM 3696]